MARGQKDLSKEGAGVRSVGKKESAQKFLNFFPGTVSCISNLLRKEELEHGRALTALCLLSRLSGGILNIPFSSDGINKYKVPTQTQARAEEDGWPLCSLQETQHASPY